MALPVAAMMPSTVTAAPTMPVAIAKIVAVSSLLLWFAVIISGRYIQHFEDSLRF